MTLEEQLVEALETRRQTLALAESCTGGLLAHRLTNVAGSSAVFLGGIIPYHNRVKRDVLGVPEEILAGPGAVSLAGAAAMATGVRRLLDADYGLAISGIAGPGGGSRDKPAGTVHLALAADDGMTSASFQFPGERLTYKLQATDAALRMLLAALGHTQSSETSRAPAFNGPRRPGPRPPFFGPARRPSAPGQPRGRRPEPAEGAEGWRARPAPRYANGPGRNNAGQRPPPARKGQEGFGPFRGPEPRDTRSGFRRDQPQGPPGAANRGNGRNARPGFDTGRSGKPRAGNRPLPPRPAGLPPQRRPRRGQ